MDCEGEGHIKGDVRIDQLVTYISLKLASVQLLNIDKILQPMNLTRLKVLIYNMGECVLLNISDIFVEQIMKFYSKSYKSIYKYIQSVRC